MLQIRFFSHAFTKSKFTKMAYSACQGLSTTETAITGGLKEFRILDA